MQLLQVKCQIVNTLCVQELLDDIRGLKSANSLDVLIDSDVIVSLAILGNGTINDRVANINFSAEQRTCTNDLRIF